MEEEFISEVVKKLRNKIWIGNILKALVNALLISSIIILIINCISNFYTMVFIWKKNFIIVAGVIVFFLLYSILTRPSIIDAAKIGDSMGLEDRLVTYLDYKDNESSMIWVFKEELSMVLEDINLLKLYKSKLNTKKLLIIPTALAIASAAYFLPSDVHEIARNKEVINKNINKELSKVEIKNNSIEKGNEQDSYYEQKKNIIDNLSKKLKNCCDYNEAGTEISKAQQQLNNIQKSQEMDMAKGISNVFNACSRESSMFKEALSSGDIEKVKELSKYMNFSQQDKQKMLSNIEKQMNDSKNAELKDKLNTIKTAINNGNLNGQSMEKMLDSIKKDNKYNDLNDNIKNLDEFKDKMLAESEGQNGMESNGGKDKSSQFTDGETNNRQSGEKNNGDSSDVLAGGNGQDIISNPNGVGGGGKKASGKGTQSALNGKVARNKNSTRLGDNNSSSTEVKGQRNKGGNVFDKEMDYASSQVGEYKKINNSYVNFKKEGMEYVLKQNVPVKKRNLVIEYFKGLNGGR